MKPTVYFRLADLRPAGACRPSASSSARCSAGRIEAQRLWTETEGRQVGMNDHGTEAAGGTGQGRTG